MLLYHLDRYFIAYVSFRISRSIMSVLLHSDHYFAIVHFRFATLESVRLIFLQVRKIFNWPFPYAAYEIYCRTDHFKFNEH